MKYIAGEDWWMPDREKHFILKSKQYPGRLACYRYQHEPLELAFKHVTSWEAAVDGGANVGLLTRTMAERFSRVYAYEVYPETFACLEKNMSRQAHVVCRCVALAESCGEVTVENHEGATTGDRQIIPAGGPGVVLPAMALDREEIEGKVGFIKLDVQGYEHRVIRGAERIIRRDRPVVMLEVESVNKLRHVFEHPKSAPKLLAKMGAKKVGQVRHDEIWAFP